MFSVPNQKMICDSSNGDGSINFYDDYCEWINRATGSGFKIYYKDIDDVVIISGIKKTVIVKLKHGLKHYFYLYKAATLKEILYKAVKRVNESDANQTENKQDINEEDYVSQLERLAKLHESEALTDEEYLEAKQKILKK